MPPGSRPDAGRVLLLFFYDLAKASQDVSGNGSRPEAVRGRGPCCMASCKTRGTCPAKWQPPQLEDLAGFRQPCSARRIAHSCWTPSSLAAPGGCRSWMAGSRSSHLNGLKKFEAQTYFAPAGPLARRRSRRALACPSNKPVPLPMRDVKVYMPTLSGSVTRSHQCPRCPGSASLLSFLGCGNCSARVPLPFPAIKVHSAR